MEIVVENTAMKIGVNNCKSRSNLCNMIKKACNNVIETTGNKYEKCIVLDTNGNIILEKSGEKSYIEFTPEEDKIMEGSIYIHNHPRGYSLSESDIYMAVKDKIILYIAVTYKYVYALKINNDMYKNLDNEYLLRLARGTLIKVGTMVYNDLLEKVLSGKLSRDRANLILSIKQAELFALEFNRVLGKNYIEYISGDKNYICDNINLLI